jgi:hypothetical protein
VVVGSGWLALFLQRGRISSRFESGGLGRREEGERDEIASQVPQEHWPVAQKPVSQQPVSQKPVTQKPVSQSNVRLVSAPEPAGYPDDQ